MEISDLPECDESQVTFWAKELEKIEWGEKEKGRETDGGGREEVIETWLFILC